MKKQLMWVAVLSVLIVLLTIPSAGEEQKKTELRPALLVIDVQNIWLPMMDQANRSTAEDNINKLIALFRKYNHPIIRVYHTDPERGPEPKTEPFEFPKSIAIKDDDLPIIKNYPSAFTKTDLDKILREKNRNTVFLCGLSATGCALATYHGAMDREFITIMVEGALLSHKDSYTKVIEDICGSMTMEEVEATLKDPFM